MTIDKGLREILGELYGLLEKRQRRYLFFIFLIMIVCAALTQFTPKAIGWITDDITGENPAEFSAVLPLLAAILVVNILNQFLQIVRRILVEDTATKTEKKARGNVISALLHAPLAYFKENMTGNIHGRLDRSLDGTVQLEKLLFMDLAPAVFNSIAAIIVIFTSLPVLLALPMMLVIPIGIAIVFRQISTQKGIRVSLLETKSAMDGSIVELLNGIEVIRITDSVHTEENRFDQKSEGLRKKEMTHHLAMAKYDILKYVNEVFFTVMMIGTSAWLATRGEISVGTVLTAYLCFTQLLTPLEELHRILDELSENMVLTEDYFQMADLEPDFSYANESENESKRKTNQSDSGREEMKPVSSETADSQLSLRHLGFAYEDEPVIEDLSLDVKKGEFVGIAGPSGCGKSTLIKAITRLEKCEGEIELDGKELSKLTRSEIAEKIALVPQSPFLIAGTLLENITYGLDETPSMEAVDAAIDQACLRDFVASLPQGIDSPVAEGGRNLSGGQKQRVAIARIFLREPDFLILDEATSALDNTTERLIQEAIEKLRARTGMTILSIAHRLTTLANCDEILVMNQGRIVERGGYRELIEQGGIFSDMYYGKLK